MLERTRGLWRATALASGWLLMLVGIAAMVPVGTRTVGPPCWSEFCLPVGILQRTGVFGQPLGPASVAAGVLAVVLGVTLLIGVARPRAGDKSSD